MTDLEQIVREVLLTIQDEKGWTTNEAARHSGIGRMYVRFVKDNQGLTLRSFSAICDGFDLTVVEFLRKHPEFVGTGSRQTLANRLQESMDTSELKHVVEVVQDSKCLGIFGSLRQMAESLVNAARQERS